MKAMRFDRLGPPDVLRLTEADDPHPGPGQVRIRVRAAGVNPVDWKIRGGSSRRAVPIALPSIPGLEAAGVIDEIGPGVAGVRAGDEVFGAAVTGAAAEYTVLDHWAVKPAAMPWAEAAALPMAVETAARALDLLGELDGRRLLISGAAGGSARPRSSSPGPGGRPSSARPVPRTRTTCGRWGPRPRPTVPACRAGSALSPRTGPTWPWTSPGTACCPT
jgi:D-arabinose 1-dehydrogenase-like Zn-dependent alcohol dehydrogenase